MSFFSQLLPQKNIHDFLFSPIKLCILKLQKIIGVVVTQWV
jgi:hypothetical protein